MSGHFQGRFASLGFYQNLRWQQLTRHFAAAIRLAALAGVLSQLHLQQTPAVPVDSDTRTLDFVFDHLVGRKHSMMLSYWGNTYQLNYLEHLAAGLGAVVAASQFAAAHNTQAELEGQLCWNSPLRLQYQL